MQNPSIVVSCPDRPGIVRAATDALFRCGANIAALEQHIEDGSFFMRIEWERSERIDQTELSAMLESVAGEFSMRTTTDLGERRKTVGLFCSKEGHCLADILGRQAIGELPVDIAYVIATAEECRMLVERCGIAFFCVPEKNREIHEAGCMRIMRDHPTDLIGLARYMRILSPAFLRNAGQPIINVHHSFLPSFIGADPYDQAYERGVKLIGATAHYVTPELDQGPIIEQTVRRIRHSHDVGNLKLQGRECEKEVFAFALRKHIENKLVIYKNRVVVFE